MDGRLRKTGRIPYFPLVYLLFMGEIYRKPADCGELSDSGEEQEAAFVSGADKCLVKPRYGSPFKARTLGQRKLFALLINSFILIKKKLLSTVIFIIIIIHYFHIYY